MIATAPRDHDGAFRWWVDLVPRLTVTAGFELSTGLSVNIVAPADAAAALLGRAVSIRVGITIDAAPDAVWSVVEPIEHHVDWMADAESIRFTTAQTRGVGTAFDCVTKVGPIRLTDRMSVTEWEPGRAMGIEHRGVVTGRGRFTLERRDGGRTVLHLERAPDVSVVDGRTRRRRRRVAGARRDLAP